MISLSFPKKLPAPQLTIEQEYRKNCIEYWHAGCRHIGEGDVLVNASFNRKRLWKNNTFLLEITHPPSYVPALVIEVPLLTLRS